jgi:hypothetical protein
VFCQDQNEVLKEQIISVVEVMIQPESIAQIDPVPQRRVQPRNEQQQIPVQNNNNENENI